MLRGLIDNRDVSVEIVSNKSGIPEHEINKVLQQDQELELPKAVALAKVFHKPWTIFLLEKPEQKTKLDQDNRTLSNKQHGLGIELVKILEDAEFTLNASSELDPEYKVKLPLSTLSTDNDAESEGEKFRKLLDIDEEYCEKLTDAREMLYYLKQKIQYSGIYVSEKPLPLEQVRAFSLKRGQKAIIVLSTKDSYQARSFSLMHEVCHILMDRSGLCGISSYDVKKQEWFCNQFSAAFLAPNFLLKKLLETYKDLDDEAELVSKISRSLNISKAATSIRLAEMGKIKPVKQLNFEAYAKKKKKDGSKTTGGNYYATTINSAGVMFSKQVFGAVSDGIISSRDAARFLGVGEKNLTKFRENLSKYHPRYEYTV
jgi:Zn-dependent peptidase ImmA (M78 family)